jgi:TonB family protein
MIYGQLRAFMNANLRVTRFAVPLAFRFLPLAGLLLLSIMVLSSNGTAQAQATESRKVKTRVDPEYPELARRLNLKGVVRVQVTVAPGGNVKDVKELGGNPVLLDALIRAVKKWKYEPADKESVVEVKFDFTGS